MYVIGTRNCNCTDFFCIFLCICDFHLFKTNVHHNELQFMNVFSHCITGQQIYCLYANKITDFGFSFHWDFAIMHLRPTIITQNFSHISALTILWSFEFGYRGKLTRISEKKLGLYSLCQCV
jgi:hypothetical protein